MELYVHRVLNHGDDNWSHGYVVASPLEVLEAARQHVDYEAAARVLVLLDAAERSIVDIVNDDPGPAARRMAKRVVNAALGIEGEET